MANPAPTINQINAFNATQGTTIDFNIIGGTELIRSNRIYIYDLSDNSLICTHLYVSTESIHELPPNTDGSIVYESGKSSADFVNGAQYYAQIQTYTDTNGTQGGSGLSVAKMFWCLGDPTLTITTIPSTISTTSYNISATYTDTSASVVSNIIQQYQFNLYSATGSLLQSSGVVVGSGTQQGTSDVYDISYNFTGLNVGGSYYVTVDVTTTQGMSVTTQSNTFTVSIDTPTLGEATVVNNACDGYISVTSNLSGEYGGSGSGEIVSFETDSENVFSKLQVELEPIQEGSGDPSPSNVRPIRGHSEVDVNVVGKNKLPPLSVPSSLNGVTITKGSNGVININGTTTANTYFDVGNFSSVAPIAGTYILSGSVGGSGTTWRINLYNGNTFLAQSVDGDSPTPVALTASDTGVRATIYISSGVTLNNVKFYPMLRLASETDSTYEPYNAQTTTQDFNATLTPTSTDTTPYLFKAVGDVYGDRLEDKIVGGTVAWNQISLKVNAASEVYGITRTVADDGKGLKYTGTAQKGTDFTATTLDENRVIEGHKYLLSLGDVLLPAGVRLSLASKDRQASTISSLTADWGVILNWGIIINEGVQVDFTVYPNTYDLTQMFGSTIADYIYSLEQSQAGAGVAWFKKLFPKNYYAYNAGELLSVGGLQSHDAVGFNQWDEEWVNGTYGNHGELVSTPEYICSKNKTKVLPSTRYYIKAPVNMEIVGYDADGKYINRITSSLREGTFTTASNMHYITFGSNTVDQLTTYNHDICINLSDPSRNGEYEPYEKYSYPLDSSLTLRGIPKLGASNNLYYDGDEYTSDGKVKRKYGVVDLGTLTWTYNSTYAAFAASVNTYTSFPTPGFDNMGVCSKYLVHKNVAVSTFPNYDDTIFICPYYWSSSTKWLVVRDTSYTDAATFKSAMSGVMLVYELATPTTQTAQAYTNPQIVSKYGTLE